MRIEEKTTPEGVAFLYGKIFFGVAVLDATGNATCVFSRLKVGRELKINRRSEKMQGKVRMCAHRQEGVEA